MHRQFAFEAGSDCLPMRVKLDRLAIKIGRDQWLGMSSDEKTSIANLPCNSKDECKTLRTFIDDALARRGLQATTLTQTVVQLADPPREVPAAVIESAREVGFSMDQTIWSKLDDDQQYALTKLLEPGKKRKRARALAEFLQDKPSFIQHNRA